MKWGETFSCLFLQVGSVKLGFSFSHWIRTTFCILTAACCPGTASSLPVLDAERWSPLPPRRIWVSSLGPVLFKPLERFWLLQINSADSEAAPDSDASDVRALLQTQAVWVCVCFFALTVSVSIPAVSPAIPLVCVTQTVCVFVCEFLFAPSAQPCACSTCFTLYLCLSRSVCSCQLCSYCGVCVFRHLKSFSKHSDKQTLFQLQPPNHLLIININLSD